MATAKPLHTEDVIQHTALVAGWSAVPEKDAISDDSALDDPAWDTAYDNSMKQEAGLLRDIFGPLLFRSVACDQHGLNNTVIALAEAIYDERAFDRLPILADALEEAGCTNADILNHCRQPGEHVRGCWVVDLILGKE
ncbi:MAG TPA: hypothetical protein VH592_25120 [Gemmataceae bacterium]